MRQSQAEQKTIVAIVTVDSVELGSDEFAALIGSGDGVVDHWILVVRGHVENHLLSSKIEELGTHAGVDLVRTSPAGISRARNDGLLRLRARGFVRPDVVAVFPDADCVFHASSRARIDEAFSRGDAEIAVGPYAPSDEEIDRTRWPRDATLNSRALLGLVASAGILIAGSALDRLGFFDERLGVGGRYSAAEDTELILRASKLGMGISYFSDPVMHHPYKATRHERAVGGNAVVAGYSAMFSRQTIWRAGLRAFVDRSGSWPRLKLRTGIKSLRAMRRFRPATEEHLSTKVRVGGLDISTVDPERCLASIASRTMEGSRTTVFAAHVTALNSGASEQFSSEFSLADFAFVDGVSVAIAGLLATGQRFQKLATTDYAVSLLERLTAGSGRPPRVAVIGGEPGVAAEAGRNLERAGLAETVFTAHGFHDDIGAVLAEMNLSRPEVFVLGIGMPREAAWVREWGSSVDAPLVLTCGGWLRLLAGGETRAPVIMQRLQIEWLWRLATDPRRTFGRYSTGCFTLASIAVGRRRG